MLSAPHAVHDMNDKNHLMSFITQLAKRDLIDLDIPTTTDLIKHLG